MITDSHSILDTWRKNCSQLFYVQYIGLVMLGRNTFSRTTSALEVEMAIAKLKKDTNHQVLIKSQQN